ncbi:MAG: tol-pal system protein YbgF [Desulfuromonas sp.]|nr:MAG: tol-pal system protein YbgF [Desulfuromonas sp.]
MMRFKYILPLFVLLALFVVGTASAASKVERDLEEMKRRLEAVEQATIAPATEDEATTARMLADQQAELDALRVEFQKLQGRFDDLEHTRDQLHELLNMMRSEMELKLNNFDERIAALEAKPQPVATKPQPEPEPEPQKGDPKAEYEAALTLVQKEESFERGRQALQTFVKTYPENELKVNALYWIGEAYYGEARYEDAILQFQKIMQEYPEHNKAAAAQLKQALAFSALGDAATTKVLLQKVVKLYPGTDAAQKAGERLKKLK